MTRSSSAPSTSWSTMPASSTSRPVEDFPVAKWDLIIALNLSSAFHTTRLAFPDMKANKWGRIINIASAHALVASPFKSAYVAAKHGILGFTKSTALEGAQHSASASTPSAPAMSAPPLVENQIADTAKARGISEEAVIRDVLLAAQPTKEFVKVSDVAAMAVFLTTRSRQPDQRRRAVDRRRLGRAVAQQLSTRSSAARRIVARQASAASAACTPPPLQPRHDPPPHRPIVVALRHIGEADRHHEDQRSRPAA